jgi:hypothetical protein
MYECRCDERPKTKDEEFTHLTYTGLPEGLEHLKVETRLIGVWYDERLKLNLRNLHVSHTLGFSENCKSST